MADPIHAEHSRDKSLERLKRWEALCNAYEQALRTRQRPPLRTVLRQVPEDEQSQLLEQLLAVDWEFRTKAGETPNLQDYVSALPEYETLIGSCLARLQSRDTQHSATITWSPTSGSVTGSPTNIPTRIGDYQILGEIARGGMGVVYKAQHQQLKRLAAVKLIRSGEFAGEQEIRRFQTEAAAAAKLDHPGIVPVFEVGEQAGQHFLAMAYVDGQSLWQLVKESPLDPKRASRLIQQVAQAVQYAHDRGIIHRDLKPQNILIAADGQPRVTDFGLAKYQGSDSSLTATGDVIGTPSYMPPEQASGKTAQAGPLADVYSLGATLYCLLTGRPPFQAANSLETLLQVVEQEPVPPRQLNRSVPIDLETICLKCLEKDPARRYESAAALASDLERFQRDEPILARPISRLEHTWRWCRRNPIVSGLTLTSTVLLLAIAIGSPLAANRFRVERNTANTNLGRALKAEETATKNLSRAVDAERKTTRQLGASYLDQVRALRQSGRPGQRFQALELVRKAKDILGPTAELVDEAASVLCLPDVRLEPSRWFVPAEARSFTVDRHFDRYAWVESASTLHVRQSTGDSVVATIPLSFAKETYVKCGLSPDGRFVHAQGNGKIVFWDLSQPTPVEVCKVATEGDVRRRVIPEVHYSSAIPMAVVSDQRSPEGLLSSVVEIVELASPGARRVVPIKGSLFESAACHPSLPVVAVVSNSEIQLLDLRSGEAVQRTDLSEALRDSDGRKSFGGDFHTQWDAAGDWLVVVFSLRSELNSNGVEWSCLIWDRRIGAIVSRTRMNSIDMLRGIDLLCGAPFFAAPAGSGLCYLASPIDGTTKFIHGLGPFPPVTPHFDQPLLAAVRNGTSLAPLRVATGIEHFVFGKAHVDPVPKQGGGRLIALSPDGRLVAVREAIESVGLFDARFGLRLKSWNSPRLFGFRRDGTFRVLLANPPRISETRFEDIEGSPGLLKPIEQLSTPKGGGWKFATETREGDILAALRYDKDIAEIWHNSAGSSKMTSFPAGKANALAVHPGGDVIAALEQSGEIRIVDSAGRVLRERVGDAADHYRNVAFSPRGTWLIGYRFPKTGFSLWRVEDWSAGPSFDDGTECAISEDESMLASGSAIGEVTLWTLPDARPIVRLRTQELTRFQPQCFDRDGSRLFAVGESTRRVHAWDLRAIHGQLAELGLANGWPDSTSGLTRDAPDVVARHPLVLLPATSSQGSAGGLSYEADSTEMSNPRRAATGPKLLAPAPGAALANFGAAPGPAVSWEFRWTAVNGASKYHVQVSRVGAAQPLFNRDDLKLPKFKGTIRSKFPESSLDGWTWKVRAFVNGRWNDWSESQPFRIDASQKD